MTRVTVPWKSSKSHSLGVDPPSTISQDFIELCYRFSQLVNPCMHLQRSLQQSLPSLRFWCLEVPMCWISLDFRSSVDGSSIHRCPFPIGWLINRGGCLPLLQQVTDDRWYSIVRPLYFCQKDIIEIIFTIITHIMNHYFTTIDFYSPIQCFLGPWYDGSHLSRSCTAEHA